MAWVIMCYGLLYINIHSLLSINLFMALFTYLHIHESYLGGLLHMGFKGQLKMVLQNDDIRMVSVVK